MFRKYSLLLLIIVLGCNEQEDPGRRRKIEYASLQIISGDQQLGKTGDTLANRIVLKVTPMNDSYDRRLFYVTPEKTKGNGQVTTEFPQGDIFADATGIIRTTWTLGCDQKAQELTFYLYYSDSCKILTPCAFADSVVVKATASTPHGWNKSCGPTFGIDRYNSKIKAHNNELYAILYGKLHKAEMGEGLTWAELPGVPVQDIYEFAFTSTGRIYILTHNHGIYTSENLQSWTSENNGILDARYPQSLLVEDSVVYASFMFDGLYRLRPGKGNFWKKLLIDGKYYEEYEFVTRHPNGDLYLIDKWGTYYVSGNSGDSWTKVPIDYKFRNYQTEDLQIHSSGMIYIGSGDASLAILDPETYTGTLHKYYEWNAAHQTINNIIFRNSDEVYYLVNHTPDPGIYSSVNGWQKIDIGFQKPISQFVFDSSGHFVIGTYDGVYYWKE